MKPEGRKSGATEKSIVRQRLEKQVSASTEKQATIEELLGTMFSIRSIQRGYK
jgi:hypothetical protein